MSTRPRRATANQKDSANDMLGLSREEERMLQRAMYDSLRQQSKFKLKSLRKSTLRKKSMLTRSMATSKLTIMVPNHTEHDGTAPKDRGEFIASKEEESKQEKEIKRGTRYSPMRKGPLSEMLKSLEKKKTQFDATIKPLGKKESVELKTKNKCSKENEVHGLVKSPKIVIESITLKPVGRPRIHKTDIKYARLDSPNQKSSSNLSVKLQNYKKKINQRTPRIASLAARTTWLSQVSDTSSPNRYHSRLSLPSSSSTSEYKKTRVSLKPNTNSTKHLVYNKKEISTSQKMSRTLLATAAKRVKKAKLKSDVAENKRKNSSKTKTVKESDVQHNAVIPPELWLDPRGQPVDTQDFINFLIFKDTPYLESSLKWFHLPPHRRKQRLYKVIQSEPGTKFNETVVYTERKEGGGKEVVVHCIPPKLLDEGSELISSSSEQSNPQDIAKVQVPASVISSSYTQAAIDEDCVTHVSVMENKKENIKKSNSPKTKVISEKSPSFEYRSKHIMQTRNRRS